MGRVKGCGLCPYNAIEKVGNYGNTKRQPHAKQKKVNTACRVGPKETDYSAWFVQLVKHVARFVWFVGIVGPTTACIK